MPKPTSLSGKKNLISKNLIQLRKENKLSQRDLASKLQLAGYDMDKNGITIIETGQRYVTDIELTALSKLLNVRMEDLLEEDKEL